MNRRSFITAAVATPFFFSSLEIAAASNPDAKWDEASQLYGNAWDVLGKAKDGEVAMVTSALLKQEKLENSWWVTGLFHNNTDSIQVLNTAMVDDQDVSFQLQTIQNAIGPGGYGFFTWKLESPPTDPAFVPDIQFGFVDKDRATALGWDPASMALQVDSASISDAEIQLKATNPSKDDVSNVLPNGLVMWFDASGKVTQTQEFAPQIHLKPGTTEEGTAVITSNFDATQPYLLGLLGYIF